MLIILIGWLNAQAQFHILDSIKHNFSGKPRVMVGIHNRNTFVNTNPVKLYGLFAGLEYREKLKLFVGLYGFGGEDRKTLIHSPDFEQDTIISVSGVSNLSLGLEYRFYRHGRWSASWPLQVGFGGIYTDYFHENQLVKRDDLGLFPIESGVNVYYEIFKWLGVKGGAGYRLSLGKLPVRTTSAPYYNLGLSILVGPLYRDIKTLIKN